MVLSAVSAKGGIVARIVSALILAPIVIGITVVGGWVFAGFVVIVAWLMTYEWDRLTGGTGISFAAAVQVVVATGAIVATQLAAIDVAAILIGVGASLVLIWVLRQNQRLFWAVVGIAYVAIPSAALVMLRGDAELGLGFVIWIFAVVWGTDIAAYAAGRILGGPKLSRISPNKTWAGLTGGVLTAAVLAAGVATMFELGSVVVFATLGAVCALISQAGDLFESWVKRRFHVKDSGRLIPGHGGVLDRVDGLLPVVVTVAIVAGLHPEGNLVWR